MSAQEVASVQAEISDQNSLEVEASPNNFDPSALL